VRLAAESPGARLARAALFVALAGYTAFSAGPLAWAAALSVRSTSAILDAPYGFEWPPRFANYAEAWTVGGYQIYLANSLGITAVAVALLLLVGGLAAHAIALYRFPLRRSVIAVLAVAIFFPPQATIFGLFQVLAASGLYDTRIGLCLAYVALQLPMTVLMLSVLFARVPRAYYDAARLDTCREIDLPFAVTFPLAVPALVTVAILNAVILWNDLLLAVVLIADDARRTLPLGVLRFMGDHQTDVAMLATGVMISVLPVLLAYAAASERIIRSVALPMRGGA